jgi:hypothetical protein
MTDDIAVKPPTTVKTVLAVAFVLAVCCCGGLGAGGYLFFHKITTANAPIRDAADAFLDDLESGDYAAAYDRLCMSTQERFSREAFGKAAWPLRAHHIDQVRITNDKGRLGGRVTATLVGTNGSPRTRTIDLRSDSGAWKVCGSPY